MFMFIDCVCSSLALGDLLYHSIWLAITIAAAKCDSRTFCGEELGKSSQTEGRQTVGA